MDYPKWAPKPLIDLHKHRTDPSESSGASPVLDVETILADVLQNIEGPVSEDNLENLRRQLYRMLMPSPLPENEEITILEALITHENMKTVWESLSKRYSDGYEGPANFFKACLQGVAGWRGDPKQTPAERKAFYQDIHDTTAKLDGLLNRASGFDFYSISELIGNESIEELADALDVPATYASGAALGDSYLQDCLSLVIPTIHSVLEDIGNKAIVLRDTQSVVKKVNSKNAEVHYFIRVLSAYCNHSYGQPLHKVVAITASAIFSLANCDETYVRKIVRR